MPASRADLGAATARWIGDASAATRRPGRSGRKTLIWADRAGWLRHPDEGPAEAQAEVRARLSEVPGLDAEGQRLNELIAERDEERERVTTLVEGERLINDAPLIRRLDLGALRR